MKHKKVTDYDYSFAVAKVRANEVGLLSAADIEQLISAESYGSALRVLEEKGWISSEDDDVSDALKLQMEKAWQLIKEVAPDISVFDFLIVKNDFHNIKAALKTLVTANALGLDLGGMDNLLTPSLADPEQVRDAILNKNFDALPDFAKAAAEETYEVLARTTDGQLADIILDSFALNTSLEMAEKTKDSFIIRLAELICATANIRIAFRAAKTGKDRQFLETALCNAKSIDRRALANAAAGGMEELINYISVTPYGEAAEFMRASSAALEKWCDDMIMSHIESAKYVSLGVRPLIAYYLAKDAEVKNVRVILSCKHNRFTQEVIRERVRKLYA